MTKQLLLTLLALGCVSVFTSRAYGCFCITPEVPEALKTARTVFLGEVVDIIEPTTSDETARLPGRFFTIKFKVQRSWKGIPPGAREFSVCRLRVATVASLFRRWVKARRIWSMRIQPLKKEIGALSQSAIAPRLSELVRTHGF